MLKVNEQHKLITKRSCSKVGEWVDFWWLTSTIRLYSAIHTENSRWKIQDTRQIKHKYRHNTQTKHNSEKSKQCKNNSKTKLSRFSRLLRHLVRKWGGLILQHSRAHTGQKTKWEAHNQQRVHNIIHIHSIITQTAEGFYVLLLSVYKCLLCLSDANTDLASDA